MSARLKELTTASKRGRLRSGGGGMGGEARGGKGRRGDGGRGERGRGGEGGRERARAREK